jgi:hypothetical protein
MHNMKTFTVAGTSKEDGAFKFRLSNDLAGRTKMLARHENTDIVLFLLPSEMTKEAAAQWCIDNKKCEDAIELLTLVASGGKTPSKPRKARDPVPPADVVDTRTHIGEDGFVEPNNEAVQVAMTRLAKTEPGFTAAELHAAVTAPLSTTWTPEDADYCDTGSIHHY